MDCALRWVLVGSCVALLAVARPGLAQVKVSEVEIWGLPAGISTADFVDQLNRANHKVCMADIKPMGYPDANVFALDDIQLVTLRSQPEPPCVRQSVADAALVQQLNAAWQSRAMHTPAFQIALRCWPAIRAQDTAAVRTLRRKGPPVRPAQYQAAVGQLQRPAGPSFEQALTVLCSAVADTVREKAFVQAVAQLQSGKQARQLLPYLRDSEFGSRVVQQVGRFYHYHPPTAAEWQQLVPEIVKGLKSPDPVVTVGLASWLTEQQVPRIYTRQLLGEGAITQLEILRGRHPDVHVFKQQLYPFLSYLSTTTIQTDAAALAYLNKFRGKKG